MQHGITGLGWVSATELDRYGLGNSLKLAAHRAVKQILTQKTPFDEIIIDGTVNFLSDTPLTNRVTLLKKADLLVKEVSAASIIAKVARDDYMAQLATQYPEYGFDKHVGYGTAAHRQALLTHGICPEHRRSFRPIRELANTNPANPNSNILPDPSADTHPLATQPDPGDQPTTTTASGQKAEAIVANHLRSLSHQIITHNFKTKTYEIDLISLHEAKIYFTEVKYRKNNNHGTPIDQITPEKRQQMHYAAEKFLSTHPKYQKFQPILAVASVIGVNYTLEDWFPLQD